MRCQHERGGDWGSWGRALIHACNINASRPYRPRVECAKAAEPRVAGSTGAAMAACYIARMKTLQTFAELPPLVGQEIAVTDWLTITQEQVNLFAQATGDHQW